MRTPSLYALAIATVITLPATALAQSAGSTPAPPAHKPGEPMPGLPAHAIDPAGLREVDDDRHDLTYKGLTVEEIEDLDVVHDGTVVGEIEEVLADGQDRIVAVAIAYGGFLALDGTEIVVPIERLAFRAADGHAEADLSEAELKTLPAWEE